MLDQEKNIDHLEKSIPELARAAVQQAYWQALGAGQSVLSCSAGFIYEEFPDGTRKKIKAIAAGTPIKPGTKRKLR